MQVRKEGLWLKALSSISNLSLQMTPNQIPWLFRPRECCHQVGGNPSGHLFLPVCLSDLSWPSLPQGGAWHGTEIGLSHIAIALKCLLSVRVPRRASHSLSQGQAPSTCRYDNAGQDPSGSGFTGHRSWTSATELTSQWLLTFPLYAASALCSGDNV